MMTDADDNILDGAAHAGAVPDTAVWTPAMEEATVAELEERLKDAPLEEDEDGILTPEQKAAWDAIPVDPAPEPRTREELWPIALGVAKGDIFTSAHLPEHDQRLLTMVFMPFGMLDDLNLKFYGAHAALLYESLDKAMPRAINGYPMFMSFGTIFNNEKDLFWELHAEAVKRVKELDSAPGATR